MQQINTGSKREDNFQKENKDCLQQQINTGSKREVTFQKENKDCLQQQLLSTYDCSTQHNNIDNINSDNPEGGDFRDCLSASDLDRVLDRFEPTVSALLFYQFRRGVLALADFENPVRIKIKENGRVFIPLHIRHHWVLMVGTLKEDRSILATIYDSAPSTVVKRDIVKILTGLVSEFKFQHSMQQHRSSNECGVFLIANVCRLYHNLPASTPPLPRRASLCHVRERLIHGRFQEAFDIILDRGFPYLRGGDWQGEITDDEIDAKLTSLGLNAVSANFSTNIPGNMPKVRAARRRDEVITIPLWFPHHWILATTRGPDVWFFDSAPGERAKDIMRTTGRAVAPKGKGWIVDSPRQPVGSNQCGLHVLINALLFQFNIILSPTQFPVMDYDQFRSGNWSLVEVLEFIFNLADTPISECPTGSEIVFQRDMIWCKGVVTSRRRGLTMIKGSQLSLPKRAVEFVWGENDTIRGLILLEPNLNRLDIAPHTPLTVGTPAPPVGPQYQLITQPQPRIHPGDEDVEDHTDSTLQLLSPEVVRFLAGVPVSSGFHFSMEGSFPPPHAYKANYIGSLNILPDDNLPYLAKTALATSTTKQHLEAINLLAKMPEDLGPLSLDIGIIEWYTRESLDKGWKASTLETKMGATAGALRLLPLYSPGASPIILGQSVLWSQATRSVHKRALYEPKKRAKPGTWNQIQAIVDNFEDNYPSSIN